MNGYGFGLNGDFFRVETNLLYWVGYKISLVVPNGPAAFNWDNSSLAFSSDGSSHAAFPTMGAFTNGLLLKSTGILFPLEPAQTIARTFPPAPMEGNDELLGTPAWPHTHTIDVVEDQIFMRFERELALVKSATISGSLQWRTKKRTAEYYLLEDLSTEEAFAGAAIADWGSGEGRMMALIFSPKSRAIDVHPVIQLQEKHKNAIRHLKIPLIDRPV